MEPVHDSPQQQSASLSGDFEAESSGMSSLSPRQFKLESSSASPLQLNGTRLRDLPTTASNEQIMATVEFQTLMNPATIWQSQYDLGYEQALNICRRIIRAMSGGTVVNWQAHARNYVNAGILDPSQEEQNAPASVNDAGLTAIVADFQTRSAALSTMAELRTLVGEIGDRLWARGRAMAVPGADSADTPLYWARIQLRNAIRGHALFNNAAQRRHLNGVYDILEQHSRGMHDIQWENNDSNVKRVLVTGFDPFGGGTSNPSGILAQRLDGMTIAYGANDVAVVEGVTFPVRYNDFDKGMVEEFAGPLLNDPAQNIFMVMTISLYGPNPYVHLDRFASRYRAGHADNSGITSNGTPDVLPQFGAGNPEFIESNWPLREMLVDPHMPSNVAVRQEGSYSQNGQTRNFDGGDDTVSPADYAPFAQGRSTRDPLPPIPGGNIRAQDGPGGDYLSNEIFYRMSVLTRQVDGRTIPNIHLHIPRVGAMDPTNTPYSIDSIFSSARDTLAVAVQNQANP